ncbi:MAG: hypothetical protein QNJ51_08415 [Calothrix sp. MO_167.B12]|nr:hypothetical protein [Calothrix sp. MO_167.B12]
MIQPQSIDPIPSTTARVAHLAFPKGSLCMKMRDEIGTIFCSRDFEALFSTQGQPAKSPWRLALVCVLQYIKAVRGIPLNERPYRSYRAKMRYPYLLICK